MKIVDEHKHMRYKKGNVVVLNVEGLSTTEVLGIREWICSALDYMLKIHTDECYTDDDINHEETARLYKHHNTINLYVAKARSGRSGMRYEFMVDLLNWEFKQAEPKRVIPNKGDQYFYIDLADENLYGIGSWLNDATDMHMIKLGLIKDTAQECVKAAKEMLKKLELEI